MPLKKSSPKKYENWKEMFDIHFIRPFKRYLGLTEKEIRTLWNDRIMMLITYSIPLVVILVLTVGANFQIYSSDEEGGGGLNLGKAAVSKEIPIVGIIDMDNSEGFPDRDLSEELLQYFIDAENQGLLILYQSDNQSELEDLLGVGEINGYVIIPQFFEYNLSIHMPAIVPVILDAISYNKLQSTQVVIDTVINQFRDDNDFKGVFRATIHNVNLPQGKSQTYFVAAPYFIPLLIFGIGALISTQSIVGDIPKDRMVLTPTNKFELMIAKVTGNFIIMSSVVLIVLVTSAIVELSIRSSWWIFFISMEIMALNAVIFGVSLSAIAKTPLAAFQYFVFVYLFMAIAVLFIGDERILPWIPLYADGALIMNVVLRGQNLWSVHESLTNLILESFILYIITYLIFKKQKTML